MATEKQIAANRRNAQKSTGPKTEEGRRVTRLNAYKHGLTGQLLVMTDEQAEVRENFLDSVVDDLKPVGVMERLLAQSIAEAYWRMNRAAAMENNIFAHEAWIEETRVTQNSPESAYKYDDIDRAFASVRSFVQNPERFQLLAVYEMRFHRKAQADLKPVGVMERLLAQSVAEAYWRMNRVAAMEHNVFAHEAWIEETRVTQNSPDPDSEYDDIDRAFASVRSFVQNPHRFELLSVYEMRFHRKAQADLKQLRELQATRIAAEKEAQAQKVQPQEKPRQAAKDAPPRPTAKPAQAPDLSTIPPQNGFVCSNVHSDPPGRLNGQTDFGLSDPVSVG